MTPRTTKLFLGLTSLVAVGALVLSAFSVKDRALEWWYLRRLGDGDAVARRTALEGLARVGSSVAVVRYLKLRVGPEEHTSASSLLKEALARRGPGGVRDLLAEIRAEDWKSRMNLVGALEDLPAPVEYPAAIARQALHDPLAGVRRWGLEVLARHPEAAGADRSRMIELKSDADEEVRFWAGLCLEALEEPSGAVSRG